MSGAIDTRPVLTPEQAAKLLGYTREVVEALMATGQLRSINLARTGKRKYLRTSEHWLEEFKSGRAQFVSNCRSGSVPPARKCCVIGLQYLG